MAMRVWGSLVLVLVLLVLVVRAAPVASALDDGEDVQYIVGVEEDEEEVDSEPQPSDDVVVMTAKSGRRFVCTIPSASGTSTGGEEAAVETVDIAAQVRRELATHCFHKTVGYWTYKACPGKRVEQYHEEKGQRTTSFDLGAYIPAKDKEPSGRARYVQTYEAAKGGRSTTITYECDESVPRTRRRKKGKGKGDRGTGGGRKKAKKAGTEPRTRRASDAGSITVVSEPQQHHYRIVIKTQHACGALPSTHNGAVTVSHLLQSLGEACLYQSTGWWTYEFCYLKHVRQFHRENVVVPPEKNGGRAGKTKAVTTASYTLGKFAPGASSLAAVEAASQVNKRSSVEDSYVSQPYGNGDVCDLTKKPRDVEVQLFCGAGEKAEIKSVKETTTCRYIMQVHTPLLCAHKDFAPKVVPIRNIVCRPIARPTDTHM